MSEGHDDNGNRVMTLLLDECDYAAVQKAIAYRQSWGIMPDGDGNIAGRTMAEICRGWLEQKGRWP